MPAAAPAPARDAPLLPNEVAPSSTTTGSSSSSRSLAGGSGGGDVAHENTFQGVLHALQNDPRWIADVNLGRRVGFYRLRGELGSGNFSQVKLATHQLTREAVAIKILDKSKLDNKTRRMLSREIATLEAVYHPNIIRLYEVLETYSKIHLVMEYASGGELFNRITTQGRIPESEAKSLFAQVVAGVAYMHEKGFIHRDIKAENVFFSAPGLVKIGDFGFSTHLTAGPEQLLSTFCGSPPYAAPELFSDDSYLGAPVDAWALGVLLYFMVTGQMPFRAQTVAALKKHILSGDFHVPRHVSSPCKRLIENLLKQCPRDRMIVKLIPGSVWLIGIGDPNQTNHQESKQANWEMQPTITPQTPTLTNGLASSTSAPTSLAELASALNISDIEAQARLKLTEYGITGPMLEEHGRDGRGARSPIIGTYRIVVHRLQRRLADVAATWQQTSISPSGHHSAGDAGGGGPGGANAGPFGLSARIARRRSRSAGEANSRKAPDAKSKTCTIL